MRSASSAPFSSANCHLPVAYAQPAGGWPTMSSVRQYLLQLHIRHHFPYDFNARSVWAVMVDPMRLVMVLWSLTGPLMWWQMRVVRGAGAVILAISLLWAGSLAYAMYEIFRH